MEINAVVKGITIKNVYNKTEKEVSENKKAEIWRCEIDKESIVSYLKNNIVKFVFLNEKYNDLSSDPLMNEIHKFKAKYRGNTYIRVPIAAIQKEGDKYISGFEVSDEEHCDGFAVVSKHDLRSNYKDMKYANKETRVSFGTQLCKDKLREYSDILSGNIFKVIITDTRKNTILFEGYVTTPSVFV